MEQIPRKRSNLQPFLGKEISLGNRRLMNSMVSLDMGDFFFCKRYGHLMGWSTPVDLAMLSWTWVMMSWTWVMTSWTWVMTS
jgi:hypothetical protein